MISNNSIKILGYYDKRDQIKLAETLMELKLLKEKLHLSKSTLKPWLFT